MTVVFFNPDTDKVSFKFQLSWELYQRAQQAARRARCRVGTFIKAAILAKLALLEKALRKQGGVR